MAADTGPWPTGGIPEPRRRFPVLAVPEVGHGRPVFRPGTCMAQEQTGLSALFAGVILRILLAVEEGLAGVDHVLGSANGKTRVDLPEPLQGP